MTTLISLLTGSVVNQEKLPVAVPTANPAYGVIGSVISLDGSASHDPDNNDLTYAWSFVSIPIGSTITMESFKTVVDDGSVVSFSPDIIGDYVVQLIVSNNVFDSIPVTIRVSIRAILVPHGRGIIPDGKFVWSYIRDAWMQVEGREWFETLWSALIQIVGAEMLKLYQTDFNKSIRDIQELYQRRWLSYEPKLSIATDDCSFYIGNHLAGVDATTLNLGVNGQAITLGANELIVTSGAVLPNAVGYGLKVIFDSVQPGNVGNYSITALNAAKTGYKITPAVTPHSVASNVTITFSFGSKVWNYVGSVNVGDVVHYAAGLNQGFYTITEVGLTTITVDKAPPSFSDATTSITYKANIYRPLGFKVLLQDQALTNSFSVPHISGQGDASLLAPGRLVTVGGQSYTLLRALVDRSQPTPVVVLTVDDPTVLTGLIGATWRAPHTIVSKSQNFEELGVATGDLLIVDIFNSNLQVASSVVAQVVGVDGYRIGVVLTDEPTVPGEVPPIPNKTYDSLSLDFGIPSVIHLQDGSIIFSGDAKVVTDYINSNEFRNKYYNKELTPSSDILIKGGTFRIQPRAIIRNTFIPVDTTLRSVPTLQNWIVQPEISEHDGKVFQVKNGVEYEVKSKPFSLIENSDFIIDGENAFYGQMTFDSGSDIIDCPTGHFIGRNIRPGDLFSIVEPVTLTGDYYVKSVLSDNKIQLRKPVPAYVLGKTVTATVRLIRKSKGTFLRFLPGGFTAKAPAPDRLWSEVSFFDNNDAIEENFGILVGLTKDDLTKISANVNYRQAVAGLMYAFTRGSSIDRVRLGAQILLGLPFAEHRGIIRSIQNDYRVNAQGVPVEGRIVAEDVDIAGTPKGLQRLYVYPVEEGSSLAGLEINPATGKTYAVGDIVEIFEPLSKGVQIIDYLIEGLDDSASSAARIQQFHSIRMRANNTSFSFEELALVSDFLRKITPSYVAFVVSSVTELHDTIDIGDKTKQRLIINYDVMTDNASFSVPHAIMYDGKNVMNIKFAFVGDGFYWIRKSGRDLSTTYNGGSPSMVATVPGGGVITPPYGEGPVTKVDDYLYIPNGANAGIYPIASLSETSITVSGLPVSGFQTAVQEYAVLRKLAGKVHSGTGDYTSGSDVASLGAGLMASGASPGDILIIENAAGTGYLRFTVKRVGGGPVPDGKSPVLTTGQVQITPTPTTTKVGGLFEIYREAFIESPYAGITATISPVIPAGDNFVTISDKRLQALADIGDELVVTSGSKKRYTLLDTANLYVTPPLPSGVHTVQLCKRGHRGTVISMDHLEFDPLDPLDFRLQESDTAAAICTSGSRDVTLQMHRTSTQTIGVPITTDPNEIPPGVSNPPRAIEPFNPVLHGIRPGDLLTLTDNGNSLVDIGYGPGVYPIVEVTSLLVKLSVALTSNDDSGWRVTRRR